MINLRLPLLNDQKLLFQKFIDAKLAKFNCVDRDSTKFRNSKYNIIFHLKEKIWSSKKVSLRILLNPYLHN